MAPPPSRSRFPLPPSSCVLPDGARGRWEGAEGGEGEHLCTLLRGLFSPCAGAGMRATRPSDTSCSRDGRRSLDAFVEHFRAAAEPEQGAMATETWRWMADLVPGCCHGDISPPGMRGRQSSLPKCTEKQGSGTSLLSRCALQHHSSLCHPAVRPCLVLASRCCTVRGEQRER